MGRKIDTAETDFSGYVVPLINGGTGARNLVQAAKSLNILTNSMKGVANGAAPLDALGKIPGSAIQLTNGAYPVNVSGNLRMTTGQVSQLKITDFDSFKTYSISFSTGTFTLVGDTITYTASTVVGNHTLTINDRVIQFTLVVAAPETPTITSPTANATVATASYNITGSTFVEYGDSATHLSTDWQVATVNDFSSVTFQSMNDTVNKLSWNVSGLTDGTIYYARVRYKATNGNSSTWSTTRAFTLIVPTPAAPSITAPVNNATGIAIAPVITTSAFTAIADGSSHLNTDWQVASNSNFATIVKSSVSDSVNKISWTTSGLSLNTAYYVRARHRSSNGKVSNWSTAVAFTTLNRITLAVTIAGNVNNYVFNTAQVPGYVAGISDVSLTINGGVVVGSNNTSSYALNVDTSWAAGDTITIYNNGGYIVGAGGAGGAAYQPYNNRACTPGSNGGPALIVQRSASIQNNGVIGGGGGGAGGGSGPMGSGGGPGGGAGTAPGLAGPRGTNADGNSYNSYGANGSLLTGGAGGFCGNGEGNPSGYYAGNGGNLGQAGGVTNYPGQAGGVFKGSPYPDTYPLPGGAAGAAVVGNGNISWITAGDIRGPVQ